ncbi:MAG: hypothetical protein COU51_00175 [Parcubacteria group bacterium CG10_big_fil_rev_8_21_14_0_10_36_14]|nr:MAG: hypothetical protein COU51_00175 [Parcubacteria group bacterium CG10_big_fil_rev_8_21_14_0_10_36_14]
MQTNLNPKDKNNIREELASFMERNSMKDNRFSQYINWKPQLPSLKLNMQLFMPTKMISLALLLAVIFGGGATAYAAEDSLPDEILYPVKNITEGMRGWMKFSSESKAGWQADLVERRLDELEKLYEDGKITEEQKNDFQQKINERMDFAEKYLEAMKDMGMAGPALGIASRLENSLKAREHIFAKVGDQFEKLAEGDMGFAEKFKEKADFMEQKRIELETRIKSDNTIPKEAVEGIMKMAENKITEVEKYISDNQTKMVQEDIDNAKAKLDEAKDAYDNGKEKLGEEKYGEAFIELQNAHRLTQLAKMISMGKTLPPKPEGAPAGKGPGRGPGPFGGMKNTPETTEGSN